MIERSVLDNMNLGDNPMNERDEDDDDDVLWILKPTTMNRGRGIHIFSTLKQLSKLVSESAFEISVKMYS